MKKFTITFGIILFCTLMGLYFSFGIKHSSNFNGSNTQTVDKLLPPKDITSPVKIAEQRKYSIHNKNQKVSYDDYFSSDTQMYNQLGYRTESFRRKIFRRKGKTTVETWSTRFSYNFDDNELSYRYWYSDNRDEFSEKMVYDKRGLKIKDYDGNNRLEASWEYDNNGRETLYTSYVNGYKEISSYDGNKKSTYRYDFKDGKEVKTRELIELFNDEGDLIQESEYYISDGNKQLRYITEFLIGGRIVECKEYDRDGKLISKTVSENDSHGKEIKITFYDYEDDEQEPILNFIRREYDCYGNPTLEYDEDFYLYIWNYTYYDGTEFIAKDHYPEYFKNSSSNINSPQVVSPPFINNDNSFDGSYNGQANSQYSSSPRREPCRACGSSGRCSACGGSGRVLLRNDPYGHPVYGDHKLCNGSGDCPACKGDGWLDEGIDY